MRDLAGRTAVVTGAASGIGLGLARRFATAGMNVVLVDLDPSVHAAARAIHGARGASAMAIELDVRDAMAVDAMADAATARFGAVHLVCNNAGVGGGGPVATVELSEWESVLGVNLWGVIHVLRSFVPRLLAHGEPAHIVNTASILGLASGPGLGPYVASKYAVVGISETLHHDLAGSNVGVSVLCPGLVNTRIFESGTRSRGQDESSGARAVLGAVLQRSGKDPAEVASIVHDAVLEGRFYVFPHPELLACVRDRCQAVLDGTDPPEIVSALFGAPR